MALVLIADDSPVARLSVVRRVRSEGLDVVEHESAKGASSVDSSAIACALLDLDLGDGSGADVATELRAKNGALPIAFFTSESGSDVAIRARSIGPVFAKPSELDAAIAWVKKTAG